MAMQEQIRSFNISFSSGVVGALAASAAEWSAGHFGLTSHFGIRIQPIWTWNWLCPRLIAGGIFGCLFALPLLKSRGLVERGILLSLVPTLFLLLYIFKFYEGYGYFGFELGALTPAFIFSSGCIWGLVTSTWIKAFG